MFIASMVGLVFAFPAAHNSALQIYACVLAGSIWTYPISVLTVWAFRKRFPRLIWFPVVNWFPLLLSYLIYFLHKAALT